MRANTCWCVHLENSQRSVNLNNADVHRLNEQAPKLLRAISKCTSQVSASVGTAVCGIFEPMATSLLDCAAGGVQAEGVTGGVQQGQVAGSLPDGPQRQRRIQHGFHHRYQAAVLSV